MIEALTPRVDSGARRLIFWLADAGPLAVAVSGGVDSLTLAAAAHRAQRDVLMLHAVSAAVPDEATRRVRAWAGREGWRLELIDAGEFADPRYRANPIDRCYFCKSHLYAAIARSCGNGRQVVSGANLDDLQEYRPGLVAARERGVRHPYIETQIDKAGVRRLCAALGMGSVAELPASPCLSSRVQTGIAIEVPALRRIHATERLLTERLAPRTVRCRVRPAGIEIELDAATLARLDAAQQATLTDEVHGLWSGGSDMPAVSFKPYRSGSAFVAEAP